MRSMFRSLVVGLAATALLVPAGAQATIGCTDQTDDVYSTPEGTLGQSAGKIALPAPLVAERPTYVVAFAHGYGHTSDSWAEHIRRTAEAGAIAFALDYPGTHTDADGDVRGWFVQEGADDTIAATQHLLALCPDVDGAIIYGVSMGGNTSGLAVAAQATRADGAPLYDYWIAGEPAANVIETWAEATAVAPAVPFASKAAEDIEDEHGGTFFEQPESYLSGTVVLRTPDIAASGIKGVAIVHGLDDGLVPYNQARELATALRLQGVPTDFYNALRRGAGEDATENTTVTENALGPTGQWSEPLAGHGTESSQTHIVIQTGLQLVFDLIEGTSIPADHEFVVDGETGITRIL